MKLQLKVLTQRLLIATLGFSRYLYVVSRFRISTFRFKNEEKDFRYFVSLIPDEGHILDIGANIGVLTYFLSKKKKNAVIHSFEPVPHNFETLKKVVRNNRLPNTRLYNIGLGDKAETVDMLMPIIDGVKKHARCQVYDKDSKYKEGVKFKIDIDRLDNIEYFHNLEHKVTAIKMDVENYEYFVIKGGVNLIKSHQPLIFCEFFPSERRNKLIAFFESLDYSVKIYDNHKLIDFDKAVHLNSNYDNFFLVPPQNNMFKNILTKAKRGIITTLPFLIDSMSDIILQ